MRVSFTHNSDKATVHRRIEERAAKLVEKTRGQLTNARYEWSGDTMTFTATAMGTTVDGTLEVTQTEVIVDARLPIFLQPFEGQARTRILGELRDMLDRT